VAPSESVPEIGYELVLQLLSDDGLFEAVDVGEKHTPPAVVGPSERVAELPFYVRRYDDRTERKLCWSAWAAGLLEELPKPGVTWGSAGGLESDYPWDFAFLW
jgi:hypothetical protein